MIIGVPKEIKADDEYRVGMLPVGAELLKADGHAVLMQRSAGLGSGFADEDYQRAGAELVDSAAEVFRRCDMIVKVKEPQAGEIARELARLGAEAFGRVDAGHAAAINMRDGQITCAAVAGAFPDLAA